MKQLSNKIGRKIQTGQSVKWGKKWLLPSTVEYNITSSVLNKFFYLALIAAPKAGMQKIDDQNLQVYWEPPAHFEDIKGVESFEVSLIYAWSMSVAHQ